MHGFIKKHNKKLMVVFGVFLMVAFLLPVGMSQQGASNPVVGRVNGKKIYAQDSLTFREEWNTLKRLPMPQMLGLPYTFKLATLPEQREIVGALMRQQRPADALIATVIDNNPDAWMLLVKEAESFGLTVSSVDIEDEIRNYLDLTSLPPDRLHLVQSAVGHMLMVEALLERVGSNVKVSQPMLQHARAEMSQKVDLNLVELNALEYEGKVAPPTTQQAEEQFKKYADDAPGVASADNPFGFGYRVPNRVKLQYLIVPAQATRDVVRASRSDYDWDRDARMVYKLNPSRYQTTQPAVPEVSLNVPAPSTQTFTPTTQPYEAVKQSIIDRIVIEEGEKLQKTISDSITAKLNADFNAYKAASAQGATTAPAGYPTFAYLQQLRDQIQADHKVTITIADVGEYQTDEELRAIPKVGTAVIGRGTFADYVLRMTDAFVPEKDRNSAGVLPVLKPSAVLRSDEDQIIFRVTSAEAEHKATSLEHARQQVDADLRKLAAYELAKADATKLLNAADVTDLDQAAKLASRQIKTTGSFSLFGGMTGQLDIPTYSVPSRSARTFSEQTMDLLKKASKTGKDKPVGLIGLAEEGKFIVAELARVELDNPTMPDYVRTIQLRSQLASQEEALLRILWVKYDDLIKRMNWVPVDERRESAKPPENDAPIVGNPFLMR